jgi:hypothetical protein
MSYTKKNFDCLDLLGKSKPKLRKAILDNADNDVILAICECIMNLLNGKVKIDDSILNKTKKFKHQLRDLIRPHLSIKKKRSILVQKGSGVWLSLLIPPILEVARKIFEK